MANYTGRRPTGDVDINAHGAWHGYNVNENMSAFMLAARYELNENVSLIAGAKYVNLDGGQLKLGSTLMLIHLLMGYRFGIISGWAPSCLRNDI